MSVYTLPDYMKNFLLLISNLTAFDKFLFYGGAPADLLLDQYSKISDIDLVVPVKANSSYIANTVALLKERGFQIVTACREYTIHNDIKVFLVYATHNNLSFDICFFDDPDLIGQYNAEALYCRYPEMDCIDTYNALHAIKTKQIIPIRGLNNENVYLLISRFIYLCAKYNMDFVDNKEHQHIVNHLIGKLIEKKTDNVSDQYISCISSLIKSVLKAKDRDSFVDNLLKSNIAAEIFPEYHLALQALKETDYIKFRQVNETHEFIKLLADHLFFEKKVFFMNTVKKLVVRKWDFSNTYKIRQKE